MWNILLKTVLWFKLIGYLHSPTGAVENSVAFLNPNYQFEQPDGIDAHLVLERRPVNDNIQFSNAITRTVTEFITVFESQPNKTEVEHLGTSTTASAAVTNWSTWQEPTLFLQPTSTLTEGFVFSSSLTPTAGFEKNPPPVSTTTPDSYLKIGRSKTFNVTGPNSLQTPTGSTSNISSIVTPSTLLGTHASDVSETMARHRNETTGIGRVYENNAISALAETCTAITGLFILLMLLFN